MDLTPDEVRWLQAKRAQEAVQTQPGPAPVTPQITQDEWSLLQLHRIAQQAPLVGSGVVANTADPMQQQNGVAIVVLRSIRAELEVEAAKHDLPGASLAAKLIDHWLGILGANANQGGSADPGSGR